VQTVKRGILGGVSCLEGAVPLLKHDLRLVDAAQDGAVKHTHDV
jgi:hypothetical protein